MKTYRLTVKHKRDYMASRGLLEKRKWLNYEHRDPLGDIILDQIVKDSRKKIRRKEIKKKFKICILTPADVIPNFDPNSFETGTALKSALRKGFRCCDPETVLQFILTKKPEIEILFPMIIELEDSTIFRGKAFRGRKLLVTIEFNKRFEKYKVTYCLGMGFKSMSGQNVSHEQKFGFLEPTRNS